MQHGKSVVWLVAHVHIALLVDVLQQVLDVVAVKLAELVHAVEQPEEGRPQLISNYRSTEDPRKKIPSCEVVLQSLRATCRRRCGDV